VQELLRSALGGVPVRDGAEGSALPQGSFESYIVADGALLAGHRVAAGESVGNTVARGALGTDVCADGEGGGGGGSGGCSRMRFAPFVAAQQLLPAVGERVFGAGEKTAGVTATFSASLATLAKSDERRTERGGQ
jgi:hypothetical protein